MPLGRGGGLHGADGQPHPAQLAQHLQPTGEHIGIGTSPLQQLLAVAAVHLLRMEAPAVFRQRQGEGGKRDSGEQPPQPVQQEIRRGGFGTSQVQAPHQRLRTTLAVELLQLLQQGGLADATIAVEHQHPVLLWFLVRQVPLKGGDQLLPVGEHIQG